MTELLAICVIYTLYRMAKGIWWLRDMFLVDREGNSGRYKHWSDGDEG